MTTDSSAYLKKENDEVQKASQKFFSGTLLSRVLGLCRDVLMAQFFGASASVAALMVAFRFSNLLRRLFGEGALHAAFVPLYEKFRLKSESKAALFFVHLSWLLFFFLAWVTGLALFSLFMMIKKGGLAPSAQEVTKLSFILFPSLFFICHAAFCSSFLQCHRIYFLPAFSPVQFNLFWITGIFFSFYFISTHPMMGLSLFISLGLIAQWALLIPKVLLTLKKEIQIPWRVSLKHLKTTTAQIVKPLSLGLLGTSATQLNNALDSVFARCIDLKGPAYLWYALRLEQVPLALFGIALSGALLPPLSRAFEQNKEDFRGLFKQGILRGMGLLIPCQVALFGFAPLIIRLIYQRGHFDAFSAEQTTLCLRSYTLGLTFQGLNLLLASGFYAAKNYRLPTLATFLSVGVNTLLNAYFTFFTIKRAESIAIATSISALCQFIFLIFHLKKWGYLSALSSVLRVFSKMLTLCLLAYFGAKWMAPQGLKMGYFGDLAAFGLQTLLFLSFLMGGAWLTKTDEILLLFENVGFKIKKR